MCVGGSILTPAGGLQSGSDANHLEFMQIPDVKGFGPNKIVPASDVSCQWGPQTLTLVTSYKSGGLL